MPRCVRGKMEQIFKQNNIIQKRPKTPKMRQRLICLFSIMCIFEASGQNIREKEELRNDSILAQFDQNDNLKYLSLMPSVSYDALNSSINIGFNISQFSTYIQTKRRNRIELAKLSAQLKEKSETKIENTYIRLENYLTDFQDYNTRISSLQFYNQLFEIAQGKHNNGEITTEQFLREKLTLGNQYLTFLSQLSTLAREAKALDKTFDQNIFYNDVSALQKKLLQGAKNFGVLGAAPLIVIPAKE